MMGVNLSNMPFVGFVIGAIDFPLTATNVLLQSKAQART